MTKILCKPDNAKSQARKCRLGDGQPDLDAAGEDPDDACERTEGA